jgi:molybdopterin converting factor small subunit
MKYPGSPKARTHPELLTHVNCGRNRIAHGSAWGKKALRGPVKILFFGKLRDSLGPEREVAPETGETVARLRRRLAGLHPQAADDLLSPRNRACVDDSIVGEEFVLAETKTVEFFPPLSGG